MFFQKLGFTMNVTLLGLAVVFIALAILIGFLYLMKLVVARPSRDAEKKTKPEPVAGVKSDRGQNEIDIHNTDNAALVAAITAALGVVMESTVGGVRIRSVRRIQQSSSWSRDGRVDTLESD